MLSWLPNQGFPICLNFKAIEQLKWKHHIENFKEGENST
jgi:hypothetical protein